MLNKKELEKQGYSFIKVEGVEFLDMSNPVEKKVIRCPIVEAEQAMRNHFLETSQKRGKALGIILPLVDQEKMTDLLSELYDLRADTRMRKAEDKMAEEEVAGVMEALGNIFDNPNTIIKKLNSPIKTKCRPKKTQPKNPQKKKVQKKR